MDNFTCDMKKTLLTTRLNI